MVASEAAPFAKTGGLADVLGSLAAALWSRWAKKSAVVMPRYRVAEITRRPSALARACRCRWVRTRSPWPSIRLIQRRRALFFCRIARRFTIGPGSTARRWDYPDNHIRFALLNQAALGIARHIFRPDVFHAHDWQAGLLAPYLRETFAGDPTFFGTRSAC